MNSHEILTKVDNEIMNSIDNLDLDDILEQCRELILEQFSQIDFKVRIYSNLEITTILNLIDKIIPGIPQADYIFAKLYKSTIVQDLVDQLVAAAKLEFNDGNIDQLANPKLVHPLIVLNNLPYYMKKFIVNLSLCNLPPMRAKLAYGVRHVMIDRKHKYLAYSTEQSISVLNLQTYEVFLNILGTDWENKDCQYTYTFTNFNELVVVVDPKYKSSLIQIWNLETKTMKEEFSIPYRVLQIIYVISKRVMIFTDRNSYILNLEDKSLTNLHCSSSHYLNDKIDYQYIEIENSLLTMEVSLPKLGLFNMLCALANEDKKRLDQLYESEVFKEIPEIFHSQLKDEKLIIRKVKF